MSEPDEETILREQGRGWLKEVAELRKVVVPEAGDGPETFAAALLEARGNLDRVEEILSQAMVTKSGLAIKARELAETADDALDKAIDARSKRARDFEAARERLASARLDDAVFPKTRAARSAQKLADMAATVEAQIRLAHRGLDSLRQDLVAALRHFAWESNLDR